MWVQRVDVYRVKLELETPFVISQGASAGYEGVLVRVRDAQGREGWGEAASRPGLFGETAESVLGALDVLAPELLGQDVRAFRALIARLDRALVGNAAAKAALDVALHDLAGKLWGVPVRTLLGAPATGRDRFLTDFTLSLDTPERMAHEAQARVEQGFRALKLKLGGGRDPKADVERVRAVREAVGPTIELRLDANQGWTVPEALRVLQAVARFDVELVEQPIARGDLEGLKRVRGGQQPVPVLADESVCTPQEALRLVRLEAVDGFNLKLMKHGGFLGAQKVATIAEAAGLIAQVGGMLETDLGQAAALQLALALDVVRYGDLDMGMTLRPDQRLIARGGPRFDPETGELVAPTGPGLGVEKLNEALLGEPVAVYERG